KVVSNQVCYSLLDQRAAGKMTELCLQHGIKLLAFGTVGGGFLSEKWLGKEEPLLNDELTWSQMKYKRFVDQIGGWN
nr:aldo/keto reductase [Algoriphagus sp.]